MRTLLPLALLLSFQASLAAATVRVPADFAAIQPALDAAQPGDTVLVAAGDYEVREPLTFRGKAIVLRSESGAARTTIRISSTPTDPGATAVAFENGETREAVLDGFTVLGGILCGNAGPTISSCDLDALSADDWNASPRLEGCSVHGVCLTGSAMAGFIHCTVDTFGADRGAAHFEDSSILEAVIYGYADMKRCRVGRISCPDIGGADLESCLFAGGDVSQQAGFGISNCTVLGGLSAAVGSVFRITNSIIWPGSGPSITLDQSSRADVTYSILRGDTVWPGEGNSNADPLFVSSSDHHLQPGSPAIDAGSGRPAGTDLDKNPRVCGPRPDLGAYEACPPGARFLRGDVVADSRRDLSDAAAVLHFLFETGARIACETTADVNDDGGIDVSDAIALLGYLFLGRGAPPPPFEACGIDPTPDGLPCDSSPGCG